MTGRVWRLEKEVEARHASPLRFTVHCLRKHVTCPYTSYTHQTHVGMTKEGGCPAAISSQFLQLEISRALNVLSIRDAAFLVVLPSLATHTEICSVLVMSLWIDKAPEGGLTDKANRLAQKLQHTDSCSGRYTLLRPFKITSPRATL